MTNNTVRLLVFLSHAIRSGPSWGGKIHEDGEFTVLFNSSCKDVSSPSFAVMIG